MTPFTRRMFYLGHALTGDRADQRRAGQDASAGSSWELFLKDFGAKSHEKASQRSARILLVIHSTLNPPERKYQYINGAYVKIK